MNKKVHEKVALKNSDDAKFIDFQIDTSWHGLSDMVDEVFNIIGKPHGTSEKKCKDAIEIVILNLIKNYHNSNVETAYFRKRGMYKALSRYNPRNVGHDAIVHVVDGLKASGFIGEKIGFYDRKNQTQSRASRMIAKQPLVDLANKHSVTPGSFCKHKNFAPIILKDELGTLKEYGKSNGRAQDHSEAIAMRNNVRMINELLERTEIVAPYSPATGPSLTVSTPTALSSIDKTLYRVFNGSFKSGGRFYGGWWETVSKDVRKQILINGEGVVERDFRAIHPTILYIDKTGHPPKGDPYILPGFEGDRTMRKIVKLAMLILINAKTEEDSIHALEGKVEADESLSNAVALKYDELDYADVIRQIKEFHPAIKDELGSGIGIRLQYKDSRLAEAIMLQLAEKNIPCLPVHDSFIVQSQYEDELVKAMQSTFVDQYGHVPVID
ncbi:hypothetical protein LN040_05215 [Desulfovibrio subterraneus]|uniref:hypothetical protein n=1 Tax=Desulfovibrio subterraneus TaxID=2718620 RepID=UPI0022B8C89C|nr:hypothetical protein [Desulfovibrio subterraneus]WBF68505.1 hypothetical protein LN040_05215 [Desulfovibrio subterraneus]